jgi:alkylation response protein AidB-like acyl-CoA dehydrogenase
VTSQLSIRPALEDLAAVTAALARTAAEFDRTGDFPTDGVRAVHDAGLLTATVAPAYGGAGVGVRDTTRLLAALGAGDPSVALISAMTIFAHAKQARRPYWPEDLYRQVLAESGTRPTLLNAARVEPELGSPARGGLPATTARRTAAGWSISGRKRFVTGAAGLSYFLVWAGTDEPVPRVGTFAVPGGSQGVRVQDDWNQLGLRASGSHDVVFEEVEIPAANLVEATTSGSGAQQDNLALGGINVPQAAMYVGVARAAQAYFHRFARERVPTNLGRPVASTDRFRQAAGEIEMLLSSAEEVLLSVADRLDRGEQVPAGMALGARVLANRHAVAAVGVAVRLMGNPGLSRDSPLERHFRDVQCAGIHAPQEDTALLAIGRTVLEPTGT